jgi:hypothetical protein
MFIPTLLTRACYETVSVSVFATVGGPEKRVLKFADSGCRPYTIHGPAEQD